jgi:hypothetical protein
MQVETKNGKKAPAKLDAFRFTTKSPNIAQAVAELFGGTVRPVELLNGDKTYEVVTDVTELPVMVPPGDNVVSQWMEMWSRGGCQRRCDGEMEQLSQSPCKCPFDADQRNELAKTGAACKPVTRLNVMLPDLPDLGVWLISSNGWNAANELGGTADVLKAARESGVIIPATLRLEQRQSVKAGQTRKFAVPVLELGTTLRRMTALGSGDIADALPPPPPRQVAIGSGEPTIDLLPWIKSVLSDQQREAMADQWHATFNFPAKAVPRSKEQAARAFIESRRTHDEPIEAELVEDPERPF